MLLQNEDGQIRETHSVSAGLDYPGVGPEHALLSAIGRVRYQTAGDEEALAAVRALSECEGILPALESAHALAGSLRIRSEEHTSELQSQSNLVCRLLLEKKKKIHQIPANSPIAISLSNRAL